MLLLAIGIVFGFSVRALSSFESIVMPSSAPKDGGTRNGPARGGTVPPVGQTPKEPAAADAPTQAGDQREGDGSSTVAKPALT